jgi:hypothetical protein
MALHVSSAPGEALVTIVVTFAGTRPASRFVFQESGKRSRFTLGGNCNALSASSQKTSEGCRVS